MPPPRTDTVQGGAKVPIRSLTLLPKIFVLEHYYFSIVTDVITPEKYESGVKIFLTCIFLFKVEKTRFFAFLTFSTNKLKVTYIYTLDLPDSLSGRIRN